MYQDVQPTIVLAEPHCELVPGHIIAAGIDGSFLTIGAHTMDGAGSSLRDWNPILLTKFVYIVQPGCAIGLRGLDIPRFDDG